MSALTSSDVIQTLFRPGVILSLIGAGFAALHLKRTRWAWLLLGAFVMTAILSVAGPLAIGLTILGSSNGLSSFIATIELFSWVAYAGLVGGVIGLLSQLAASRGAPRQAGPA